YGRRRPDNPPSSPATRPGASPMVALSTSALVCRRPRPARQRDGLEFPWATSCSCPSIGSCFPSPLPHRLATGAAPSPSEPLVGERRPCQPGVTGRLGNRGRAGLGTPRRRAVLTKGEDIALRWLLFVLAAGISL